MKLSNLNLIAAVVLAGLLAGGTTATGRDATANAPAGGKHAQLKNRLQKVAAELNLTDDQKQQLKPILQDEAQKLKALRADTSRGRAQKHAQLKAIRQDFAARAKPILTAEQVEQWQQLRAAMHAKRRPNT